MATQSPDAPKTPAITSIVDLVTISMGGCSAFTSSVRCENCTETCTTLMLAGSVRTASTRAKVMCQKLSTSPARAFERKRPILSVIASSSDCTPKMRCTTIGIGTMPFSLSTILIVGMMSTSTPSGMIISSSMRLLASTSVITPASTIPFAFSMRTTASACVRWPVPLPQKATMYRLLSMVEVMAGMGSGAAPLSATPISDRTVLASGSFHQLSSPWQPAASQQPILSGFGCAASCSMQPPKMSNESGSKLREGNSCRPSAAPTAGLARF